MEGGTSFPYCSPASLICLSCSELPGGPAWCWQGNESCSFDPRLPRGFPWPTDPSACSFWNKAPELGGRAASSRGQGLGALALEADNVGSYPDSTTEVLCDCRLHLLAASVSLCVKWRVVGKMR